MVGREVELVTAKTPSEPGEVILDVEDLNYINEKGIHVLKDVSFQVRAGEIVGVCGVDGNGQSELVKCLTGLLAPASGRVELLGKDVTHESAKNILDAGVGHIPEDRHKMGMVGAMNLRENIAMVDNYKEPYSTKGFMHWRWIDKHSRELVQKFSVKTPSIMEKAINLSGGNQQKMVVGRELSRETHLLIAVHPSRGLDIGATKYIQSQIVEARDRGAAVLMVSTELDEILEIPDRVLVIYGGRILACLEQAACSRNRLGLLMAGITEDDEEQPA
jgi:simple sugar transport system ATP-binding protein